MCPSLRGLGRPLFAGLRSSPRALSGSCSHFRPAGWPPRAGDRAPGHRPAQPRSRGTPGSEILMLRDFRGGGGPCCSISMNIKVPRTGAGSPLDDCRTPCPRPFYSLEAFAFFFFFSRVRCFQGQGKPFGGRIPRWLSPFPRWGEVALVKRWPRFSKEPFRLSDCCDGPTWTDPERSVPFLAPQVPGLDLPILLSQARLLPSSPFPCPHLI